MPHTTNRRDFLKQSAAATTATLLASSAQWNTPQPIHAASPKEAAVNQDALPVVDTHQHLWDLTKLTLPWLKNEGVQAINRNFVMSDYLKATKQANVVKTVYMEVNVHPSQQVKEAEYVIDLCQRDDNPMQAAVIGGYPHDPGFAAQISKLAKSRYIKGVRTVLHDPDRPRGLCLKPEFIKGIKHLGELGLSFDLCMRPDELMDGVKLAKTCPNTRFVMDHCGNMSIVSQDKKQRQAWMDGIKAASQLDNMVCKISGIVVTAENDQWKPADLAPNMNFCMDAFGADRAYFGGDWPVCTLKSTFVRWVDALKWIVRDRSREYQQKLFHDNAVRFYGLS